MYTGSSSAASLEVTVVVKHCVAPSLPGFVGLCDMEYFVLPQPTLWKLHKLGPIFSQACTCMCSKYITILCGGGGGVSDIQH